MTVALLLCMIPAAAHADAELPFKDVAPGDWFYDAVLDVWQRGAMLGQSNEIFAPNKNMTRAELVTLLSRIADADLSAPTVSGFSDVKGTEWYAACVLWAADAGLVRGYENGTFKAENQITRQELAALFVRLLKYIKLDIVDNDPADSFADADSISGWAFADVEALRITGLVRGDKNGNFNPKSSSTRAEVATMVSRLAAARDRAEDPEQFIDPDGTEYSYTFVGSVNHDTFANWLRSMADATLISDSISIVDTELSGTKDITVTFTVGERTVTRTYKVTFTEGESESSERRLVFVAPGGDDSSVGSIDAPLATLAGARDAVRKLSHDAPISVFFRSGVYNQTATVDFDGNDSGTPEFPITYAAYRNENVTFSGAVKIDPSKVTKADSKVSSRIIDESAAEELMQIDLSSYLTKAPAVSIFGNEEVVYMGETPLTPARWPNANDRVSYQRTVETSLIDNGDGTKTMRVFGPGKNRAAKWSDESLENLYIHGYFAFEWHCERFRVEQFDRKTGNLTVNSGAYGYNSYMRRGDKRYYYLNVLEEIDVPGESYIDPETLICYFLPGSGFDPENLSMTLYNGGIINLCGTSNVTFDGLDMEYARGHIVNASNADTLTFKNCTIAHGSSRGMTLVGSRITVDSCEIYDFELGGIDITGGNRTSLTSGESLIVNCDIHDGDRTEHPNKAAVLANSLGLRIMNCEIYNFNHEGIEIRSNDVEVLYNEFHDCGRTFGDMGVVYFGRDPSLMGIRVNYNYFHDIGNEQHKDCGVIMIYEDDGTMGAEIIGNIFARSSGFSEFYSHDAAIFGNGAQFSDIRNNIFVDVRWTLSFANWNLELGGDPDISSGWFADLYNRYGTGHGISERLLAVNFDSEIWREHYRGTIWEQLYKYVDSERLADYAKLSDEDVIAIAEREAPRASNILKDNLFVSVGLNGEGNSVRDPQVTNENNYTGDTDMFVSYENSDFRLTADGLKRLKENPFEKIGLIK